MEEGPSFSPDGNQVAFMWNGENQDNEDIFIKQIGSESLRRMTTDPHFDAYPAWSPDGQYIAFLRFSGPDKAGVMLIPANGGRERQLAELPMWNVEIFSRLLCWHPGGKWLAVVCGQDSADAPSAVYLISVETREKRRLALPPSGVMHDTSPAFSPDGRSLVFARYSFGNTSELYVVRLSTGLMPEGEPKQLTSLNQDTSFSVWTPDSKEIIFASGSKSHGTRLWRIPMHGPGRPRPLPFSSEVNGLDPAISLQKHRLVYVAYSADVNMWRCEIPKPRMKPAAPQRFLASTRVQEDPRYSPDGKTVAYIAWASGSAEIWECDRNGTNPLQLTHLGGPMPGPPQWSPDGQQIVFTLTSKGQTDLYVTPAQGGEIKPLTHTPFNELSPSFSWNGKWIYFSSDRGGNFQVWKMPSEGGEGVLVTRNGGSMPQESMDGKLLFYMRPERTNFSRGELWKVPSAGGEEARVIEDLGSFEVKQHGIYYCSRAGQDKGRTLLILYEFAKEKARPIATLQGPVGGLSVSPDEQTILYVPLGDQRGDLMLVENFH
jgi:Tol biopolymer transport system component